jgi:hypothetical protein
MRYNVVFAGAFIALTVTGCVSWQNRTPEQRQQAYAMYVQINAQNQENQRNLYNQQMQAIQQRAQQNQTHTSQTTCQQAPLGLNGQVTCTTTGN